MHGSLFLRLVRVCLQQLNKVANGRCEFVAPSQEDVIGGKFKGDERGRLQKFARLTLHEGSLPGHLGCGLPHHPERRGDKLSSRLRRGDHGIETHWEASGVQGCHESTDLEAGWCRNCVSDARHLSCY